MGKKKARKAKKKMKKAKKKMKKVKKKNGRRGLRKFAIRRAVRKTKKKLQKAVMNRDWGKIASRMRKIKRRKAGKPPSPSAHLSTLRPRGPRGRPRGRPRRGPRRGEKLFVAGRRLLARGPR